MDLSNFSEWWNSTVAEVTQDCHDAAVRRDTERRMLAQQWGLEAGQIQGAERAIVKDWHAYRPKPTPDPAPGSQEEIDTVERGMNLAKNRLDGFLETSRFDARSYQVESGALMGRELTDTRLFLEGQRPEYERLHREFKELKTRHETLLAARRIQEREHPTPAAAELPPRMLVPFGGLYYGF